MMANGQNVLVAPDMGGDAEAGTVRWLSSEFLTSAT